MYTSQPLTSEMLPGLLSRRMWLPTKTVSLVGMDSAQRQIMSAAADTPHPLYWESSYEIVLQLIARYPDVDLDSLGLQDLYQMIVTLPDFVDDPTLAHDDLLTEILREYYEEATTHDQR